MEIDSFDAVVLTDVAHHIDDDTIKVILEKINSCLQSKGMLVILDVDKKPFWKFCMNYSIDSLLNPRDCLYYRSLEEIQFLLEKYPLILERIIPAHKGLPLSDIIYLYRKKSP